MKIRHTIGAFAVVLAMGQAAPALAQTNDTATNIQFTATDSASNNVVAEQMLRAVVANLGVGTPPMDQATAGGHRVRTGDTIIAGNAFASFSGVLTQSFNTGVNSTSQAATNIAFSGSLSARSR